MINALVSFAFFWGVWLLVPILVDSIAALIALAGTVLYRGQFQRRPRLEFYPEVTILIPVFNCAGTLFTCVASIAKQSYPLSKIEVILIDNGSTDNSYTVFQRLQNSKLKIAWHRIVGKGKAWALNTGIHLAKGQYLLNIDCDLQLDRNAVLNAVAYLEANKDVGAATGYLVVQPAPPQARGREKLLANLEFLEYATVFGVGRSFQSYLNALFTLSGAFSIFRREILLKSLLYNKDTVSEDTELTFQLYARASNSRIVSIPNAIAYLEPTETWSRLYSQRLRWQRGQLEVSASHRKDRQDNLFGFSPTRVLLVDHTLAMPRLIWTAFLPILTVFNYPAWLITMSYLSMYLFYFFIEIVWFAVAFHYAEARVRRRLWTSILLIPLMPIYRLVQFYFRVAGFFYAIAEPFSWNTGNPVDQVVEGLRDVEEQVNRQIDKF
jgi:putative glycosyltransferase (exosortase G-associated)